MRLPTAVVTIVVCLAASAGAQDRPFVFSIATPRPAGTSSATTLRLDYDVGGGERLFQGDRGDQPEQQFAVQVSHGRLLAIGRVGLVSASGTFDTASSGELLYAFRQSGPTGMALAAGGGVLHEIGGANVLVARVLGGHEADTWRLHGNLVMQKPLDAARDGVDLITAVGWARRVTPAVALGVEAVGEDLEGFWDPFEAEGGARLLVGPSVRVAPASARWQLLASGGPTFHPADTGRLSTAARDLPPSHDRYGYAAKVALSYRVF